MTDNYILPYCVYRLRNDDKVSKVSSPAIDTKGGYTCKTQDIKLWKYSFTFYTMNPAMPIIPNKISLVRCEHNNAYPYGLTKVLPVFDRYNNGLRKGPYILSYSVPTPNTSPVYFYTNGTNLYPSLENKPPGSNWLLDTTIYTVDTNTYKNVPFRCINSRCIPWTKNIKDVFNLNSNISTMSLDNCITYCSKSGLNSVNKNQVDILQVIEQMKNKSNVNIPHLFIIGILLGILLIIFLKMIL